ncbi:MAG: peptide-methionine (S)-S-oxide reductase MsrA [Alphaproteobacteria bacterium]|nr:peptide-methionine (S)-S-oxide reductase MsrA [Alphaproteobacteria bacterium]
MTRPGSRSRSLLLPAALLLILGGGLTMFRSAAEEAREIPPPAIDGTAGPRVSEVAVLAGGCFWGVQGVFQHVAGVTSAVSGYAGGTEKSAKYDAVSAGLTDHAEAVRVVFDPRVISYGRVLQILFSVIHDPTQLDRQGPDIGRHYRSSIFPQNEEQARIARAYIAQLDETKAYPAKIVTKIESGAFYPAEPYHQDFMVRNPRHPYIAFHDLPKVEALKRFFPDRFRADPVLVAKN